MEGFGVIMILAIVWTLIALGAALAIGRMVRRGNEEQGLFGSLHAPQPENRPRPRLNRHTTDRDASGPEDAEDAS